MAQGCVAEDPLGDARRLAMHVPAGRRHSYGGSASRNRQVAVARHLPAVLEGSIHYRMPRPVKHDERRILGAAASLVAARGPGAATIPAIGAAIGAPSGSIYHRFRSRDELLGRLWLTKARFFQDRWAAALKEPDPRKAGLEAALSMPRAARDDFEGARIMLLHRREDFLGQGWPPEMQAEAERLSKQVTSMLAGITRRLFGRDSVSARQIATFAVLDLPFAAVRRFVAAGKPPPLIIDDLVAKAYAAVVDRSS
jgi:AcrR family transcriptional regulator